MEFCISCGGIIPNGAAFCPNCGAAGTKYRLEHANEGGAAPAVTQCDEPEHAGASAEQSSEGGFSGPTEARLRNERILNAAAAEAPSDEAAQSAARRRNERILNGAEKDRAARYGAPGAEPVMDSNTMAITGFVFSLLPIPFFLSPIIGLILSSIAHRRAKSGLYRNDMASLAIAGKVISIVRIVFNVLIIAAVIAAVSVFVYMRSNGLELDLNKLFS